MEAQDRLVGASSGPAQALTRPVELSVRACCYATTLRYGGSLSSESFGGRADPELHEGW